MNSLDLRLIICALRRDLVPPDFTSRYAGYGLSPLTPLSPLCQLNVV